MEKRIIENTSRTSALDQCQRQSACKHKTILKVLVAHQGGKHISAPTLLSFEKTIREGGGKDPGNR